MRLFSLNNIVEAPKSFTLVYYTDVSRKLLPYYDIYYFFSSWKIKSKFLPLVYFFFSLNNNINKKKIYANVPEMFNFDPKQVPKILYFYIWYNFFNANVLGFCTYLTAEN